MLFCRLLIFFKITFFEKFFQEYHQHVNSLDPDQQKLSAEDTSRQRVDAFKLVCTKYRGELLKASKLLA